MKIKPNEMYKHATTVSSIKLLAKQFNEWYIKKMRRRIYEIIEVSEDGDSLSKAYDIL